MKSINFFKTLTAVALLILAVSCGTKKQEEESTEVAKEANDAVLDDRDEEKDADFVVNTLASNYAEVKLAKLAQNRSQDPEIKDLAKMLETDHNRVISELKTFADKNGIAVPSEETNEDKEDINDLASENDTNKFDEKWCKELKNRHEKSINKFEARLNKSEDLELKNWVNATLPALRNHLEMLKQNEDRLK
ncbi:MAG TPA: DUF4142 domain-containing protein [Cyclobacteriaceae bacterium]